MKSEDCYRQAADEIESGRHDRALWAWALAESGGDADKTRALYIRRRVAALVAAASTTPMATETELQRLRSELRRQLALQQKNSLYSVVGVAADCSDRVLGEAIARLCAAGQPLDAETRYAVETLGDAHARERFDRRLLEQLSQRPVPARKDHPGQAPLGGHGGSGLMALVAVVLLLGAGYLGLGYMREKSERELRFKEAEARQAEIRRKAASEERAIENQKIALEASIAAQQRAAETREQQQIEARMREDKARLDYAYRQEQQQAQADQRRQQIEQRQAEIDARRREYEAANQTRAIRQQAIQDAIARGNHAEAQRLRNQQY